MKNLLIIFTALLFMTACDNIKKQSNYIGTYNVGLWSFDCITIDSCEYLLSYTYGDHYVITHKGNCKNPIHKLQNK